MKEESYKKLKFNSQNFKLSPPDRTWNRLEYKLDRLQFEKKRNWENKIIYAASVAVVLILIVSSISILKQETQENNINSKSKFIVNKKISTNDFEQQVYNIHTLNEYYSKMESDKFRSYFKKLKVNNKPKG